MKGWDELVSAALIGTAKRPVPDASTLPEHNLADAAARLNAGDRAAALLDRAALLTLWRRAGTRPRTGLTTGQPAPADSLPRVPEAAARRLVHLLSERSYLLPEWLELCATGGWRLPEESLPTLFHRARADRTVAARLPAVVGERGRWLAARVPEWQAVLDRGPVMPNSTDAWETGRLSERVAHLSALRQDDPARARELLAETWAVEEFTARAEFIAVLDDALSEADEPFLEAALDDRRKEIRKAAERLLCRIPGSAYAARMRERLLACVTVRSASGRTPQIVIQPPATPDAVAQRDGIPVQPPTRASEKPRDLWLRAIVVRTQLSVWTELTTLPANRVVELPFGDDDAAAIVHAGWQDAAVRQRNTEWAKALLASWTGIRDLRPLLAVLDPADRCSLTARALATKLSTDNAARWIDACPAPWDERLGRAILAVIKEHSHHGRAHQLERVRAAVAQRLPPRLAPDLEAVAAEVPASLAVLLHGAAEYVRFRHEMTRELR